jgi:hypothetical protein
MRAALDCAIIQFQPPAATGGSIYPLSIEAEPDRRFFPT